jgi:5,6-dimethylbenzimidazole synthase
MPGKSFTEEQQRVLAEIMSSRRDIRGNNFTSKEVTDEDISKLLETAHWAPSVGFSQPWEFVVIRDKSIKTKVAECFSLENEKARRLFQSERRQNYTALKLEGIHEAPVNIAVFYKPTVGPVLGQTAMPDTGEYSVVCAIQNMWLMSRAMNLGIGWVSIINPEKIKDILHSPPRNKLIAYLCIGYVSEFHNQPELEMLGWEERKPIKITVHDDQFPIAGTDSSV